MKKHKTRCMNGEANDIVDFNKDKSIDAKDEVKMVGKSLRALSFCEKMKILLPICCPLRDSMKDKKISTLISFNQVYLHKK